MRYEIERLYLTDPDGRPHQVTEPLVTVEAVSARDAAHSFVTNEGARLLGEVCDAPGNQCTATAWRDGRLYVLTVWPSGARPGTTG